MRSITFSILRILSDSQIHSGAKLAQSLNCSRATISNALQGIEKYGVNLSRIRGCGYRWSNPICWIDKGLLVKYLSKDAPFFSLMLFDTITSTNSYLSNSFDNLLCTNKLIPVVVSELQTDGRGRRGRRWKTGLGDSLTFSILWKFDQGASSLSGLSLVISLAIIRVLRGFSIQSIGLKWPNDVLLLTNKLAGTLVELRGEMCGPTYAVIGIGLNLKLSRIIKSHIDQPSSDLFLATGMQFDRNIVLAVLLSELRQVLIIFTQLGFSFFQDEWNSYHLYKDKHVILTLPDMTTIEGVVDNINVDGSLNLVTPTGRKSFNVGDISLRLRV